MHLGTEGANLQADPQPLQFLMHAHSGSRRRRLIERRETATAVSCFHRRQQRDCEVLSICISAWHPRPDVSPRSTFVDPQAAVLRQCVLCHQARSDRTNMIWFI